MVKAKDLIAAFEYPTLKIPYEVLNQGYRNLHRDMETKRSNVRKTCEKLLSNFGTEGNEPIEVDEIRQDFLDAYEAWKRFQDSVRAAMAQMDWYTESLLNTTARLRLEVYPKPDETELCRWKIDRDRTSRLICSYLLRCGRLRTAHLLSTKIGILSANVHEITQFELAQGVYDSIKARETDLVHAWITEHRQKLRKMKSKLELAVRIQDTISLLQKGHRLEALKYAREHLRLTEMHELSAEDVKEVNQVWALVALGKATKIVPYSMLMDENRYESLAELFREEFWRLFDLPYQSAFSLSLQCGLAAYKTPQCTPGGNSKCIICQTTVFPLADGLPHAHTGLSIVRCAFSGELINEDNPPWMVPKTGRVYGEQSLARLTRDDKFHCIATDEWVARKDLLRLYIL